MSSRLLFPCPACRRPRLLVHLFSLLPVLWLAAACTTNPATGKQSFTAFMSREDELRIGADEHPKLIKEFGGAYTDAKLVFPGVSQLRR